MKVHVISNKPMFDDKHGRLVKGAVVDMLEHKANFYLQRGEVEMYETKVVRERPFEAAGKTEPSSALPPAQVSQQMTAKESDVGVKKTRKKKEA